MKINLFSILLVYSFLAFSQECNLITDTRIYWPAPEFSKPAYLNKETEPVFGTKITRIVGNPGEPIPNINGEVWAEEQLRHQYSKRQPWNSDQTIIYLNRHSPNLWIDAQTYEVLFTREKPSSYVVWSHTEPHIMNYVTSNCVGKWDVVEDTTRCIVSFSGYSSCTFGMGEGNFTNDGSKVVVNATRESDGHKVMFIVDMENKIKGPDIDVDDYDVRNTTISPLGNYIIIGGDLFGTGGDRIQIRNALTGNIIWEEELYGFPSHFDTQIDQNGDEIIAGTAKSDKNGIDYKGKVIKRRLSDGKTTIISDYSWASHTSGRNLNRPGWVFVTYQNREGSSHYPYYNELVAVKLDGSRTERICHLYSYDFDYVAESHGVPSPDGLKVMWASDWENNDFPVQAYVADFSDKVVTSNVDVNNVSDKTLFCYPNPSVSTSLTINFNLEKQSRVQISIYDVSGKKVKDLTDQFYDKGNHSIFLNAKNDFKEKLTSGTYIIQLQTDNFIKNAKIVLKN